MDKKELIKFIEKNGFIVKGKTCQRWQICYMIKSLNENYSISISPVSKKTIVKAILATIEYWKFVGIEETTMKKAKKEIENIVNKLKKIIGEINEKHD